MHDKDNTLVSRTLSKKFCDQELPQACAAFYRTMLSMLDDHFTPDFAKLK